MKYYVYPDGTISDEILEFMSDDFAIVLAEDDEDAYQQVMVLGLI